MRVTLTACCVIAATLGSARAEAEVTGDARATLLSGLDTNARRDYDTSLDGLDALASLQLELGGMWRGEKSQARLDYAGGARKFIRLETEDTLVQNAALNADTLVTNTAAVGIFANAKDRRGARRDYSDLSAYFTVDFFPDEQLDVRVRGGAHRFLYRPDIRYSFGAGEAGASASWRFDKRHSAFVFGDYGDRKYMMDAEARPGEVRPSVDRRLDRALSAGGGYEYRGRLRLRVDYSYGEQVSNSFGQSNSRHRFSALFATYLIWKVQLVAQGVFQITNFWDGLALSPEILLVQDEENATSLSVKLVRALTATLDVEVRYSGYFYRLPGNDLNYLRHVAWGGLSVHL